MKKRIPFAIMLVAIACMLAFSVSADEVSADTDSYYLVQNLDSEAALALQADGKTNIVAIADITSSSSTSAGSFFNSLPDDSNVELIFAENIVTSGGENVGILLNKPITVTVRYNGFIHAITNGSKFNGFTLRHSEANLILIGSQATDENGEISTEYVAPTYENGKIIERGNLDAYHFGKVYVWVFTGNVYAENMRTKTNEEFVYTETNANGIYEFKGCACDSNSYAVGLNGKTGKTVKLENGYYNGLLAFSVLTGSYAKNITVAGKGIQMDCWDISGQIWEFTNCSVNKVTTYSGRTHFNFIDCIFEPSTLNLGSDGGGVCKLYAYTSPTCLEAGTKITYAKGDNVGVVDTEYPTMAPALGHEADPNKVGDVHYDSFLENGKLAVCIRCGITMADENIKANPLFKFLGYSTPEDGSYGIVASFIVDYKAVAQYEEMTGKKLSYGIVAGAKSNLGDNNPLDANGNVITLEKGNVIKADVDKNYGAYDFKLTGLNEGQLDLELVIATYVVVDDGESVSVVYLQNEQVTENLSVISYNAVPTKDDTSEE